MNMPASPPQESTWKPEYRGFVLLSFFAGVVLAILITVLAKKGVFVKWDLITQVPENTASVVGGEPYSVYVQSTEGIIYSCSDPATGECWVRDYHFATNPPQSCDERHIAFRLGWNKPENLISCVFITGGYPEMSYDILFAIDHDGNLWKWELDGSSYEMFVFPILYFIAGIGGVIIGNTIWIIKRLFDKRRISQRTQVIKKGRVALFAVSGFCVLALVICVCIIRYDSRSKSKPSSNVSTGYAETATPGVGKIRFSFTQDVCDATWTFITCSEDPDPQDLVVSTITNPSIGGKLLHGEALRIPLTLENDVAKGNYPIMEVQEGDHFKTTIGCLDESTGCDIQYTLWCEMWDENRTIMVGSWSIENKDQAVDVDIDLTQLAGKRVRFRLDTSGGYPSSLQSAAWFMPRIEGN